MSDIPQAVMETWVKIVIAVGGALSTFILGVFSAGYASAIKISGFEKKLESHDCKFDSLKIDIELMNDKCKENRVQMREIITFAVRDGMHDLDKTWGEELAGARDQRVEHTVLLANLQIGVQNAESAIIRVHERIDEILGDRKGKTF